MSNQNTLPIIKNFIQKALHSWKAFLEQEQNIDFDNNNEVAFLLAINGFENTEETQKTFKHFFEHQASNKEFLDFLEDYQHSFIKEQYGLKGIQEFEREFLNLLLHLNPFEENIFGEHIKPIDYWSSDNLFQVTNEDGSKQHFALVYYTDTDLLHVNIKELEPIYYNEQRTFVLVDENSLDSHKMEDDF